MIMERKIILLYAFAALTTFSAHAADDAFVKSVAAMPPEEQVKAVVVKLKVLNPQFDCLEQHKVEGGAVTELSFSTVGVTDISPVKALSWLRKLTVAPAKLEQKGMLADLSPLSAMQLTWLWCHNNPIADLTPLHGMPLTVLSITGTRVTDLSPLAGMKLQVLSLNDTLVADLSPLAGMPLTVLWCNNTQVKDLSPVKGMPLQQVKCDFVAARDAAILREIKTLAKINDMAAQVFWARVGPTMPANTVGATASAPSVSAGSSRITQVASAPAGSEKTMMTSTGMELVWIPPGQFLMGSTAKERDWALGREGNLPPNSLYESGDPRETRIKNGFWLGRTKVTVGQWQKFVAATAYVTDAEKAGEALAPDRVTGKWDEHTKGASWRNPNFGFPLKDNHPICCISWNDAVAFCEWLTKIEQKAGRLPAGLTYRLPSEAEWEYACRGGVEGTKFWWGDSVEKGKGRLNACSAVWQSQYKYISPVDAFGARGRNGFGLADMLGNVQEWCLDGFDPQGAHAEPYTQETELRALRGGSFMSGRLGYLRCAARSRADGARKFAANGFRVCGGAAW